MAAGGTEKDFKLVIPDDIVEFSPGQDVTLRCYLSPATSAVAMEIRWFKKTECIYLYKNGDITVREGYEGRVSVDTQKLQRGDVSLRLKEGRRMDEEVYTCQVINGGREEERVGLWVRVRQIGLEFGVPEIHAEERRKMEESVQSLVSPALQTEFMEESTQPGKRDKEAKEMQIKDGEMKKLEDEMVKTTQELEGMKEKMEKMKELEEEKNKDIEKKTEQLEEKIKEGEKMTQKLEEGNKLLQQKETELMDMTKREMEREGLLEKMTREVETNKRQLESLEMELQERNRQLQDLRTQLQEKEKELEEKNQQQESEKQQEGLDRHQEDPSPPLRRKRRKSINRPPSLAENCPDPEPLQSSAGSELRLVLIGGSAAGQKAAANTILGTHTSTETQHSECRWGEVAGRWVTLVETADWFCSGLSEKDMRQDVKLCVQLSAPGPHAFLLVIPEELSERAAREMLEKMEDIFGEGCWRHTLILFTNTKGLRERGMEELLQKGSRELQQLVEKCGNRYHLLNVKDRPDYISIAQLLEKIEEMSRNKVRFYSSEIYQEAERHREEEMSRALLDRSGMEFLKKMEEEIKQKEISKLHEKIEELERKMNAERDEQKKREMERNLERIREERDKERKEMEERHRDEIWEMRENYESKTRADSERNLIKVILAEQQRKMEAELNRQKEENKRKTEWTERKERETETLKQNVQRLQATLAGERERQRQHLIQYPLLVAVGMVMSYSMQRLGR
ncbi:trichohyalin-like isoform X2 [Alosa alosa]|uniref:trichohyalin-like isoform X2 n=1 Tax=Alosa alosa TaxID=278164 RepID=UPI0020152931|nr:trichohyalin-like isoform X2 [Alosa alosa]